MNLRGTELIKVCLNRYSWGAGKEGSEYSSWFIQLECMSCANLYANQTKNGGRRLPDVKHECYGKLSVKSFLNVLQKHSITGNRLVAKGWYKTSSQYVLTHLC